MFASLLRHCSVWKCWGISAWFVFFLVEGHTCIRPHLKSVDTKTFDDKSWTLVSRHDVFIVLICSSSSWSHNSDLLPDTIVNVIWCDVTALVTCRRNTWKTWGSTKDRSGRKHDITDEALAVAGTLSSSQKKLLMDLSGTVLARNGPSRNQLFF